jgi:hypothetical protein
MKTPLGEKQQDETLEEHVHDVNDVTGNPTNSVPLRQKAEKSSALFFSVKRDIDDVLDLVAQVHRATKHILSDPIHGFSCHIYSVFENL